MVNLTYRLLLFPRSLLLSSFSLMDSSFFSALFPLNFSLFCFTLSLFIYFIALFHLFYFHFYLIILFQILLSSYFSIVFFFLSLSSLIISVSFILFSLLIFQSTSLTPLLLHVLNCSLSNYFSSLFFHGFPAFSSLFFIFHLSLSPYLSLFYCLFLILKKIVKCYWFYYCIACFHSLQPSKFSHHCLSHLPSFSIVNSHCLLTFFYVLLPSSLFHLP
jgi:hypothetical protein